MRQACVVVYAGQVLCPSCGSALHASPMALASHEPPPDKVAMRCLNSRCDEKGVGKMVPLPRIEVELAEQGENGPGPGLQPDPEEDRPVQVETRKE